LSFDIRQAAAVFHRTEFQRGVRTSGSSLHQNPTGTARAMPHFLGEDWKVIAPPCSRACDYGRFVPTLRSDVACFFAAKHVTQPQTSDR
jgi:hypothetical protein